MRTIDRIKGLRLSRGIVALLAMTAIVGWYFAGARIPGRYQIVSSSESVTMVDTLTGRIRVFGFRKLGSSSYRDLEGNVEVFELTNVSDRRVKKPLERNGSDMKECGERADKNFPKIDDKDRRALAFLECLSEKQTSKTGSE